MTNPLELGKNSGMLHVLQGPLQGQAFPLQAPEMQLGREGGALKLNSYVQMSRQHARLFYENGVWSAQDLGSTNGTHVNGERIATRLLQDGDVLQLGDFKARVSLPNQMRTASRSDRTQVAPQLSPPTQIVPPSSPSYPPPSASSPVNPAQHPWPQQSAPQYPVPQQPPPPYIPPAAPHYQPPPIPPPQQYPSPVSYAPPADNGMSTVGLVLGIIALCLMLVGMVPCLGLVNWLTLLLAGIGAVLSVVGLATNKNPNTRSNAIIGLTLSLVAFSLGGLRLIVGISLCMGIGVV